MNTSLDCTFVQFIYRAAQFAQNEPDAAAATAAHRHRWTDKLSVRERKRETRRVP